MTLTSTDSTPENQHRQHEFLAIDRHFARLLANLGNTREPQLLNLFAQLSQALRQQHSCLDLARRHDTAQLLDALQGLPCVSHGGQAAADPRPLVLEGSRLYLQRYYQYECRIARDLISRNRFVGSPEPRQLQAVLAGLFAPSTAQTPPMTSPQDPIDWQAMAVLQALSRQLTIITGGPGTGKTTTVLKLLQGFKALPGNAAAVIKLAAPTGKAAMRLGQSLKRASDLFSLPTEVLTLHRLLGLRADGQSWRHDQHHPLQVDLLIVDEVSMIDLAMMDRLLRALPAHCRLVLLGDPNQLPAVDTGNILMDICQYPAGYSNHLLALANQCLPSAAAGAPTSAAPANAEAAAAAAPGKHQLQDAICHLTRSYRFAADKGIGQLARDIQAGGPLHANNEVEIHDYAALQQQPALLLAPFKDYLAMASARDADLGQLLDKFDAARILTTTRAGEFGVTQLNQRIEAQLLANHFRSTAEPFYPGRPVMVTRNDYALGLFNGDVGICVPDPGEQRLRVAFRLSDGSIQTYLSARLPPHETCFAMTVHKSQGSEFQQVTLILADSPSRLGDSLASRELLYTAVTRARQGVTIYSTPVVLNQALNTHAQRASGLAERFLTRQP